MTKFTAFTHQVEDDLLRCRTISEQRCDDFTRLNSADQRALASTMGFLGCKALNPQSSTPATCIREHERVVACRLMLLKLAADTGEPRWSSWVLDRMLDSAMSIPGGSVTDVLRAVVDLLGGGRTELTPPLARFLKELVTQCWVRDPESYRSADLHWLAQAARHRPSGAVAYLALYALPNDLLPGARTAIQTALEPTAFREEAMRNLEGEPVG